MFNKLALAPPPDPKGVCCFGFVETFALVVLESHFLQGKMERLFLNFNQIRFSTKAKNLCQVEEGSSVVVVGLVSFRPEGFL